MTKKIVSLRDAFGRSLVEIGKINKDVIVLDADVAHPTRACFFEESFPDRFIQAGISEQNMVSVAAGLASCRFIPIVVCFAAFLVRRCFDQIYNSICFPNLNVKLVGGYCGFTTWGTGASHQTFDDIAIMNTLPNVTIINVGDPIEVDKAMKEIVKLEGPVYIRIGRLDESESFYTEQEIFQTGRILKVCEGTDAAVLSTGIMSGVCKKALQKLREDGISLALYHIPTLKPVNTTAINLILQGFKNIYTVEDHNIFGGLGSIINDTAIKSNTGNRIINIGIRDKFGKCGSFQDLFTYFGLSEDDICKRIKSTLFNDHMDV